MRSSVKGHGEWVSLNWPDILHYTCASKPIRSPWSCFQRKRLVTAVRHWKVGHSHVWDVGHRTAQREAIGIFFLNKLKYLNVLFECTWSEGCTRNFLTIKKIKLLLTRCCWKWSFFKVNICLSTGTFWSRQAVARSNLRMFRKKKKKRPEISVPKNFEHRVHTSFDAKRGCFVGLPTQWQSLIENLRRPKPMVDPSRITEVELRPKKVWRPHLPFLTDNTVTVMSCPFTNNFFCVCVFFYLSPGWANDPAVYIDCTVLNPRGGCKIYYCMQAINNSRWCLPTDVKQEVIKSAGTAEETPVCDAVCTSQDFRASPSIMLMLLWPSRKIKNSAMWWQIEPCNTRTTVSAFRSDL